MSLVDQISLLANRLGVSSKNLRTLINGNVLDLSALATRNKSNLVSAINELTQFPLLVDHFFGTLNSSLYVTSVNGAGAALSQLANSGRIISESGAINLGTGTTATGRIGFVISGTPIYLPLRNYRYEAKVNIPLASTSVEEFACQAGFMNGAGALTVASNFNDGFFFEYDRLLSSNWRICVRKNSTFATHDQAIATTVPVSFATITNLEIYASASGAQADFYINSALVGTINTGAGIPLNNRDLSVGFRIEKKVGLTSRSLHAAYLKLS